MNYPSQVLSLPQTIAVEKPASQLQHGSLTRLDPSTVRQPKKHKRRHQTWKLCRWSKMIQLRRQVASGVQLWGPIQAAWLTPVATSGVGGVIFLASLVVQECWTMHPAEPQPSNSTPLTQQTCPFFRDSRQCRCDGVRHRKAQTGGASPEVVMS